MDKLRSCTFSFLLPILISSGKKKNPPFQFSLDQSLSNRTFSFACRYVLLSKLRSQCNEISSAHRSLLRKKITYCRNWQLLSLFQECRKPRVQSFITHTASGCTKCLSGHYKAKSSFVEFTNPFILQPSSFCRKTVFLKN